MKRKTRRKTRRMRRRMRRKTRKKMRKRMLKRMKKRKRSRRKYRSPLGVPVRVQNLLLSFCTRKLHLDIVCWGYFKITRSTLNGMNRPQLDTVPSCFKPPNNRFCSQERDLDHGSSNRQVLPLAHCHRSPCVLQPHDAHHKVLPLPLYLSSA